MKQRTRLNSPLPPRGWLLALLLGLGLGLLPASPLAAEQPGKPTPKALVQQTVDRALAVLRDPKLQGNAKRDERFDHLRGIVNEIFDWSEMARRCLGIHWRSIDEAQRARFVAQLERLLADRYMEDINRFRGDEQVLVEDMHKDGDVYRVDTVIVTHSREKVPINYFMHASGSSFRVHDFSIEGVSLVNHYRKSFTRFLVNQPFDKLLDKLEAKGKRAQNPD